MSRETSVSFVKEDRRTRQFVHTPKRAWPIGSEDFEELHGRGYDDGTVPVAGEYARGLVFKLGFMVDRSDYILWVFSVQRQRRAVDPYVLINNACIGKDYEEVPEPMCDCEAQQIRHRGQSFACADRCFQLRRRGKRAFRAMLERPHSGPLAWDLSMPLRDFERSCSDVQAVLPIDLVLFSPVVDLPQRWRYQCGPRPLGMTRQSSPRCRGTDPTWPDKRAAIQAQDRDRPAENLLVLDPFARPHGGRVEHQQQHQ